MIEAMCEKYGSFIATTNENKYYSFPTVSSLATAKEEDLRSLGFGYRARYIVQSATQIMNKDTETGYNWLESLRSLDRPSIQKELISLMGIGRKVADCIALFSLDQLNIVPVDTHVWQIAQSYMPKLKNQKLNDKLYEEIGDFFRDRFGNYCGWAHTMLFASDLSLYKVKEEKAQKKKAVKKKATSSKTRKHLKAEEGESDDESEGEKSESDDSEYEEKTKVLIPISKRRRKQV
jgi:N-glycosylase/DNA lyase